jgi:F-box interacting protein
VLYIRRRDGVIYANVYSRNEESWRDIPLSLPSEYLTTRLYWSSGTLCDGILYFIVNDIMIGGTRFMVSFDINSEQFYVHSLPPIPNYGLAYVRLVDAQNKLVMFSATGYREIQINMWIYEEDIWYWVYSFPKISLDLWCSITHFVTNGNKWFVMAKSQKIFELHTDSMRCGRSYPSTHWACFKGALFTETLVSPSV